MFILVFAALALGGLLLIRPGGRMNETKPPDGNRNPDPVGTPAPAPDPAPAPSGPPAAKFELGQRVRHVNATTGVVKEGEIVNRAWNQFGMSAWRYQMRGDTSMFLESVLEPVQTQAKAPDDPARPTTPAKFTLGQGVVAGDGVRGQVTASRWDAFIQSWLYKVDGSAAWWKETSLVAPAATPVKAPSPLPVPVITLPPNLRPEDASWIQDTLQLAQSVVLNGVDRTPTADVPQNITLAGQRLAATRRDAQGESGARRKSIQGSINQWQGKVNKYASYRQRAIAKGGDTSALDAAIARYTGFREAAQLQLNALNQAASLLLAEFDRVGQAAIAQIPQIIAAARSGR